MRCADLAKMASIILALSYQIMLRCSIRPCYTGHQTVPYSSDHAVIIPCCIGPSDHAALAYKNMLHWLSDCVALAHITGQEDCYALACYAHVFHIPRAILPSLGNEVVLKHLT